MRSDHWNFLANLLGTPTPAEPPKKKEEKPSAADTPPAVPVAEQAAPEQTTSQRGEAETAAEEEVSFAEEAFDTIRASGEQILDALAAAVPPQILPGFGPSADEEPSIDEPR